jgi:hypothetical protein
MVEQHRDAGENLNQPDFEQVFLPHLDAAYNSPAGCCAMTRMRRMRCRRRICALTRRSPAFAAATARLGL